MLEPLLCDLKSLEEDGTFVPCLGKILKGTVFLSLLITLVPIQSGDLLKVLVGRTVVDFVSDNGPSFRNLKSGQENTLVEQNGNIRWTLKQHWLVTPIVAA